MFLNVDERKFCSDFVLVLAAVFFLMFVFSLDSNTKVFNPKEPLHGKELQHLVASYHDRMEDYIGTAVRILLKKTVMDCRTQIHVSATQGKNTVVVPVNFTDMYETIHHKMQKETPFSCVPIADGVPCPWFGHDGMFYHFMEKVSEGVTCCGSGVKYTIKPYESIMFKW